MNLIFDAVKAKPFAAHLGLSESAFSQKKNGSIVNGSAQKFSKEEQIKIKQFALFIAESIVLECEKI
ncbi:MAG: hypothetical protein MUF45_10050 [Spirosomaceae bacterium]|jgi:hypothetical protein|nr:hypothetical protein [Spirosomataceae bacterium]